MTMALSRADAYSVVMTAVNLILPDATRKISPAAMSRILEIAGLQAKDNGKINAIIATGAHKPDQSKDERARLGIPSDINIHVHDCDSEHREAGGYEFDPVLWESDLNILAGPISFHYLAGFGGGRKLIAPGCASRKTINQLHRQSYNADCSAPAESTGMGNLESNPFHEALSQACDAIDIPNIGICIVDDDIFEGPLHSTHKLACSEYQKRNSFTVKSSGKNTVVEVPHDTDLYQAHKALIAAARVTDNKGRITLKAECPDGLGPGSFSDGLQFSSIDEHAAALNADFSVSLATSLSLRRLANRFCIAIASDSLPFDLLTTIGITKASSPDTEYDLHLPYGAGKLPIISK